ncbi:MAG TPA: hypothetical protein VK604_09035 [Bryobacteraceae bacterium]|nr:hypothetical protein [Bryobacteraceae bacterium]
MPQRIEFVLLQMSLLSIGKPTVEQRGNAPDDTFQRQLNMVPIEKEDRENQIILIALFKQELLDEMLDEKPRTATVPFCVCVIAIP